MTPTPIKKTRIDGVTQTYHIADGKDRAPTANTNPITSTAKTQRADALTAAIDAKVDKFLDRLTRARGPQSRRDHERFFAAQVAHLDGITPVEATYLQKCYRDAEAATTFTGEMTAQRALTAAVTRSLFPGATSFTFHYIHEDHPVLGTVTDATGNTLYTHSTGTPQDTKRATAIEAFLGGFPKDVLLDYFNDTATGYTHNF